MNSLFILLGRSGLKVADLERIYSADRDVSRLVVEAVGALTMLDSDVAWRAVWILKRLACDRGLSADDVIRIANQAEELPHWAARLNLCQLFAATGCPEDARETLFPYLVECFANRRPMVRAWALSVLVGFEGDSRFQETIDACLERARTDPAGSIQSRLRRLKKQRPNPSTPTQRGRPSLFG